MSDTKQNHNSSVRLSADKPIQRRDQDVLGRSRFSEAVARAIRGWLGRESIVIALYGPWGNGKTSIKNMVVDSLRWPSRRSEASDGAIDSSQCLLHGELGGSRCRPTLGCDFELASDGAG